MKFAVLAFIAVSMSGCGENYKIKEALRASLIDPDSAKFGKLSVVNKNKACMTVNSKNSMGGYVGDQQAFMLKSENTWQLINITNLMNHEECIEFFSKQK